MTTAELQAEIAFNLEVTRLLQESDTADMNAWFDYLQSKYEGPDALELDPCDFHN